MPLQFWATIDRDCAATTPPGIQVMAPISAWWRHDVELRSPVILPHQDIEVAIDTGSFTFAQRYADGFPFGITAESIFEWCSHFRPLPRWVVLPDWPCEGATPEQVADRQERTIATALVMLDLFADAPWTWVPVVQGWRVDEYARMAQAMAGWVYALRDFYAARGRTDFRVGIGSICRRGQVREITEIIHTVAAILPEIPLHLFGIKLNALHGHSESNSGPPTALPEAVVSLDTAAWNRRFGSDIPFFNAGMAASGLTQRQYAWSVAYPEYRARLKATISF